MTTVTDDPAWLVSIENAVDSSFTNLTVWFEAVLFWSPSFFPMPWIVAWLLVGAIVITVYLGFPQRGLGLATKVVRGKFSSADDPGEIPHYQALTSAVSGTVGLGNIAGVGAAVVMGGPGATFWMIVAGLLGMATKFAECTLGVKYREIRADGTVSGGPFKYLPVAFSRFPKFISVGLTGVFAVAILLFGVAGGNMFQSNQTYAQLVSVTGGEESPFAVLGWQFGIGLIIAALIGAVIIGGMKSIGRVTSTLVPFMGGLYVLACLFVILTNIGQIPGAVVDIVGGAFNPESVAGGVLGALIVGLQRSAFSNEAGLGSAPIAHSVVKTRRPVSEGFVALFEPLIDTVLICTMTALTIVIADTPFFNESRAAYFEDEVSADGVVLTSDAFESSISWFPYILALAVTLFAISTLITWSYYGQRAWAYLFNDSKVSVAIYRAVFLLFTVMGCVVSFGQLIDFTNVILFLCAFVNLLGVYFLLPVIKREMKEYWADYRSGKLYDLGNLDHEKEHAVEDLADENQVVDATGRNRLADPDDDGFGSGGATVPRDRR